MISFVCRVHNEEKTLREAIASLNGLEVPHEIILILHRCSDDSPQIAGKLAAENKHVRVCTFDRSVSRAGLETLVTRDSDPHSLPSYLRWCCFQASGEWLFRYDADFVASDALIAFLNSGDFAGLRKPTRIVFPCVFDGIENREVYLSNCVTGYRKHIFWEVAEYEASDVLTPEAPIAHASSLEDLKNYWTHQPWFSGRKTDHERELHDRYDAAIAIVGHEPPGAARASNPACNAYFERVIAAEADLRRAGISFYE